MKKILWLVSLSLALAGAVAAGEHTYSKMATPHDLMAGVVKPNMDKLAAIRKEGGPKDMADWKHVNAYASLMGEAGQIMLMDGWVKDATWADGATKLVDAAKATMSAAMKQDAEGVNAGMGAMGAGCKTCHAAHKPK
ncbi:MAG: cytochrome c [Bryobacterales bacterium]|nr:cytochrome c [Bryobacterales bacterium]